MKSKPGITLAVSHNIHLTRDQRYALADGESVDVQGVSVPVWFFKGRSSEPGMEVFSDYKLLHDATNQIDIEQQKEGYIINIPADAASSSREELPPDLWNSMSEEQKEEYLNEIPTGDSLRDLIDGGSGKLSFNQYNKSHLNGMIIHILHFIRIARVEDLEESLI